MKTSHSSFGPTFVSRGKFSLDLTLHICVYANHRSWDFRVIVTTRYACQPRKKIEKISHHTKLYNSVYLRLQDKCPTMHNLFLWILIFNIKYAHTPFNSDASQRIFRKKICSIFKVLFIFMIFFRIFLFQRVFISSSILKLCKKSSDRNLFSFWGNTHSHDWKYILMQILLKRH